MPGARNALLDRAAFSRKCRDRVSMRWCGVRLKEVGQRRNRNIAGALALHPDLVDAIALPIGEQADAVSARCDSVIVICQLLPGQILIDALLDLKNGNDVERQLRDHPECAKADDHSAKPLTMLLAGNDDHLAVGRHQFHRGDGGGEVAIGVTRTVGRRRAGARDGNMRQRRQVVQRVAFRHAIETLQ